MSSPKTVVSVTPMALDGDSRTLKIARSLARFGYRSIVVEGVKSRDVSQFDLPVVSLSDGNASQAQAPPTRHRLREGTGVTAADAVVAAAYRARYQWKYGLSVARRLPAADLYYLHAFTYGPAIAHASRRHGAAYIYDAHDCYPRIRQAAEFSDFERNWINPFLEQVEQRCCDRAVAVVTVSDGVADLIAGQFGRRPEVLRNAHDRRTDRPPPHDIRAITGIGAEDKLIVVVGHDKAGQTTETAISALAGLPDKIHLAFAGRGYDRHRAMAIQLGLEGRVHFVGHLVPDSIVPSIATADAAAILLFPYSDNYRLALPNKFFQAIAAGLPVIYPAGLEELARTCSGYGMSMAMDARDIDSLRAAFSRLVADPAGMAAERAASRRAGAELSWAAEEGRLQEMLAALDDNRAKH